MLKVRITDWSVLFGQTSGRRRLLSDCVLYGSEHKYVHMPTTVIVISCECVCVCFVLSQTQPIVCCMIYLSIKVYGMCRFNVDLRMKKTNVYKFRQRKVIACTKCTRTGVFTSKPASLTERSAWMRVRGSPQSGWSSRTCCALMMTAYASLQSHVQMIFEMRYATALASNCAQ